MRQGGIKKWWVSILCLIVVLYCCSPPKSFGSCWSEYTNPKNRTHMDRNCWTENTPSNEAILVEDWACPENENRWGTLPNHAASNIGETLGTKTPYSKLCKGFAVWWHEDTEIGHINLQYLSVATVAMAPHDLAINITNLIKFDVTVLTVFNKLSLWCRHAHASGSSDRYR